MVASKTPKMNLIISDFFANTPSARSLSPSLDNNHYPQKHLHVVILQFPGRK